MEPNRSDQSDREHNRSRSPRHSHRRKRNDRHADSIDSGYGGSSATVPRQSSLRDPSRGLPTTLSGESSPVQMPKHHEDRRSEGRKDSDSDSDYDPKARHYITVDDDAYPSWGSSDSGSHQGGESAYHDRNQSSKSRGKRRDRRDGYSRRDPRSDHDRRRAPDSRSFDESDEDTPPRHSRSSRRTSSRRYSDSSRDPHSRRVSSRGRLSPIPSDEEWETSPERMQRSHTRSRSRYSSRRRASGAVVPLPDDTTSDLEEDYERYRRSTRPPRSRARPSPPESSQRKSGKSGSSSYKGAADMEDAWYKTFKERLMKGVDMKQVKETGLNAAAVAAVKVAVGTQVPWKQRIPKTIAVGCAAAVTDFIVSKTSFQPKGMVGTMYARQFVEIALANLIINPVSTKVTGAAGGVKAKVKGGDGNNKQAGPRGKAK